MYHERAFAQLQVMWYFGGCVVQRYISWVTPVRPAGLPVRYLQKAPEGGIKQVDGQAFTGNAHWEGGRTWPT